MSFNDNSPSSSSRLSILEKLRRSRATGEIYRDLSSEVEPLYEYVDESEFKSGKKSYVEVEDHPLPAKKSRKRVVIEEKPSKCLDIRKMMRLNKELEGLKCDDSQADDDLFAEMMADFKTDDVPAEPEMEEATVETMEIEKRDGDKPIAEAFEQLCFTDVKEKVNQSIRFFWLSVKHLPRFKAV
ncbi:hypothetical protein ACOME3_003263 [Neoechinorhynchus agilis]